MTVRTSNRADDGAPDRGSAVVEFVLVAILLITLLLAVLQVAVYVHVRNTVVASAAEGARYGANADRDTAVAAPRTAQIVTAALGGGLAGRLDYEAAEVDGAGGSTLVAVHVSGSVPTFLAFLGPLLPLDARARALKEGRSDAPNPRRQGER